jgi:hypothetical protein
MVIAGLNTELEQNLEGGTNSLHTGISQNDQTADMMVGAHWVEKRHIEGWRNYLY